MIEERRIVQAADTIYDRYHDCNFYRDGRTAERGSAACPRETRVSDFDLFSRRHKWRQDMRTIQAAVILGTLFLGAAYATPVAFSANGSFLNGAVLSGTVTIDTATGTAVSGNLALSGVAAHFTTLVAQSTGPSPSPFFTELDFGNGQATDNFLGLVFKPVSLTGYAGGELCHFTPANCPATNSNSFYVTFYGTSSNGVIADTSVLQAGSLSLPAPEPSTLVLLGGGLVALAWKIRSGSATLRPRPSAGPRLLARGSWGCRG